MIRMRTTTMATIVSHHIMNVSLGFYILEIDTQYIVLNLANGVVGIRCG